MTGLWFLLGAILITIAIAVVLNYVNGRFRMTPDVRADDLVDDGSAQLTQVVDRLTAEEIGESLGERASLVQFSSAFCSPCRATRVVLGDVAKGFSGVAAIDIDAESHLDLVNRFGVVRTPTVLIVNGNGQVVSRASGVPRKEQVVAALEALGIQTGHDPIL